MRTMSFCNLLDRSLALFQLVTLLIVKQRQTIPVLSQPCTAVNTVLITLTIYYIYIYVYFSLTTYDPLGFYGGRVLG